MRSASIPSSPRAARSIVPATSATALTVVAPASVSSFISPLSPSNSITPSINTNTPPQLQHHHFSSLQPHHCTPRLAGTRRLNTQRFLTSTSRIMSSMPATGGHSAACCNIPPIVSSGYKAKGSYEEIGGYKTYVTGPEDATKAIVVIFDIFGFFDQTVQGADILAYSDDHQKYKVYMPDWFHGKPCPIEIYPPDTKEKEEQLGAFFGQNSPPKVAGEVPGFVQAIKEKSPSLTKFGILGFCWGGKVAVLAARSASSPFSAAASAHPAMVDAGDAGGLTIPFAMLASGDEDADDVKRFEAALKVSHHVETFGDQIHGWMAARSDLGNERVKGEYERGYKTVLTFFGQHF